MKIRRLERGDLEAVVGLNDAVRPQSPTSLQRQEYWFELTRYSPVPYHEVFVGELDGRAIAVLRLGHNPQADREGTFNLSLIVAPDYRGAGRGKALWGIVEERLRILDWTQLLVMVSADQRAALAWLSKLGFERVHEDRYLELRLEGYRTPVDYFRRLEAVSRSGIRLLPFGEIDSADKVNRLWELWSLVESDVPHGVGYQRMPFERWREMVDDPVFDLDEMLVALDGERFVGLTGLIYPGGREKPAYVIISGVLPEYRRRGLATALKYLDVERACQRGLTCLITGNAAQNSGILKINQRLGFEELPAVLTWIKKRP